MKLFSKAHKETACAQTQPSHPAPNTGGGSGRHLSRALGLAAALAMTVGCESTGDTTPVTTVHTQTVVVSNASVATVVPAAATNAAPVSNAVVAATATNSVVATNAPAEAGDTQQITVIKAEPPKVAAPEGVKLTPGVEAVLKLVQSGVGEDAILAYVNKTPAEYDMDAETIVYLTDLGVSSAVIAVMLNNDTALDPSEKEQLAKKAAETNAPAAVAAAPAPPVAQAPQAEAVTPQPQLGNGYVAAPASPGMPAETVVVTQQVVVAQQPQVIYTTPPAEVVQNYFYTPLQPYGSWVEVSGYGWCWRPTVAYYDPHWRPYHTRGRWMWSNHGWYWQSDYSWGWAAFHYGRWSCPTGVGWVWVPDYTWGPAWVSWRRTDAYCGWAPLPPRAHYRSGFGFSYYDRNVGISFDFGLRDHHYTFVRARDFCDPHPWRRSVPRHETVNIYNNSTVVNNYIVGNNNTIINNGVGHDFVAANTRSEIRKVTVQERPDVAVNRPASARGTVIAPDRVTKVGKEMVVYRPTPPPPSAVPTTPGGGIAARGEPTRATVPTARLNSRTADRVQSDIAARPNSSLVTPSRRPEAVGSPSSTPGGLTSRPTAPSASPNDAIADRGINPRREPITAGARDNSSGIGSGLVTDQANASPSTRPGIVGSTPAARPDSPANAGGDDLSRRLREVRREGISARPTSPTTPPSSAPSQRIGADTGSAVPPIGRTTPLARPGAPNAGAGSIPGDIARPSSPVTPNATTLPDRPALRRIEPIRNPAPQAPSVSSAPGSSSYPGARPGSPFASTAAQDLQRSEPRAISPRFNNSARGVMNANPAAQGDNARPFSAPAPIVSQPVTPAFRSAPIDRPALRQIPSTQPSPRFSSPVQESAPAPVMRQPQSVPQSIPSYRSAPVQSAPSAPVIQSQPLPSRPAFESRPSSRPESFGGGARVPIQRGEPRSN
ncbi:MAG TPA: DUF6600 domain-containing protein [Methylomirabilota bacterium]|nr:DUF6600 domain-containing protein [Methylomirabilota bacterium]